MVWGFGLNMVVGTGVFAIVTFAMFGSAMIPRFLSNGYLLRCRGESPVIVKRRKLAMHSGF
jgi:hypothetical protein